MKKKVLFVIESLTLGGAEKSLTTLLNLLDYSKYEVDLQLFTYGGEFQQLLPNGVKLLPKLDFYRFCDCSVLSGIKQNDVQLCDRIKMTCARIKYSLAIRKGNPTNPEKAVLFWQSVKHCFQKNNKEYDIAISYAQGVPTFYVKDMVFAKKKFAWINSNYKPDGKYKTFVESYFQYFDGVVGVSEKTSQDIKMYFNTIADKVVTIYDIINADFINKMALIENPKDNGMDFDGLKIVTVGRMCMNKGYDIALDACKLLIEKGIDFRWFVVGDGALRNEIESKIIEYGLSEYFILLGAKKNPYPYINSADIYVQTSRFEGYCMTLTEARVLNKPCVTTEFECVYNQMIQEKNGLVVDMNAQAVADGIEKLLKDRNLYNNIVEYLKNEKKGNTEEIEKFYSLID